MIFCALVIAATFGAMFVAMSYNSFTGKFWWEKGE